MQEVRASEFQRSLRLVESMTYPGQDAPLFPGAVVAAGRRGRTVLLAAIGDMDRGGLLGPMSVDAVFDVASVTKVVVTGTAAMQLVDDGGLELDDRVEDFLPRVAGSALGRITVAQLLAHQSGIPWLPLYEMGADRAALLDSLALVDPAFEPGAGHLYSCVNFVLLGWIVESITDQTLDRVAGQRILRPAGMDHSRFLPIAGGSDASPSGAVVPTEVRSTTERGRRIDGLFSQRPDLAARWAEHHPDGVARGVVHDENAAYLGGIAGNAGLFSTAGDLLEFGQAYLDALDDVPPDGALMGSRAAHASIQDRTPDSADEVHWGLAWQLRAPVADEPDAASDTRPWRFGHTGYTGAMVEIDRTRQDVIVVLTNRLQMGRNEAQWQQAREAVLRSLHDDLNDLE